jgi:hypothetical protein
METPRTFRNADRHNTEILPQNERRKLPQSSLVEKENCSNSPGPLIRQISQICTTAAACFAREPKIFLLEKHLQSDVCFAARSCNLSGHTDEGIIPKFGIQQSCCLNMSSPLNGRALAFPVIWGPGQLDSIPTPQPVEFRAPSDEELMAGLQAKDAEALDLLFGRYSRLVFAIAVRILNDHNEAEDAVQEVFFRLYQKAALFDSSKGSAKGWIVQIAFSRARDRRAHLSRRGFYSGTDVDSLHDLNRADRCRARGGHKTGLLASEVFF